MASFELSADAKKSLEIMMETNGFENAEADINLCGL